MLPDHLCPRLCTFDCIHLSMNMVILRLKTTLWTLLSVEVSYLHGNAVVAKYLTLLKNLFDLTFIFPVVASCAGSKHSWHFMKTSWYLFHFLKNLHVKEIFFCHFLFDIVILLSQEQGLIPYKAHCKLWWLEDAPSLRKDSTQKFYSCEAHWCMSGVCRHFNHFFTENSK